MNITESIQKETLEVRNIKPDADHFEKKAYKLRILFDTLKRGKLITFFHIFYLMLRKKIVGSDYYLVFEKQLSELKTESIQPARPSDFRMILYTSPEEISEDLLVKIRELQKQHSFDLDGFFADGQVLWTVESRDELAGVIWTKPSVQMKQFYFPMPEDGVFIILGIIHPRFRGRGFFASGLKYVMDELSKMQFRTCYIMCYEWNLPSRKTIEKTGFLHTGKGRYNLKTEKLEWIPVGSRKLNTERKKLEKDRKRRDWIRHYLF